MVLIIFDRQLNAPKTNKNLMFKQVKWLAVQLTSGMSSTADIMIIE
jgi:hypothetical protein